MCLLLEVLEPLRLLVTEALALQRSQRSRSAEEMLCGRCSESDDERAREGYGSLWSREQNRERRLRDASGGMAHPTSRRSRMGGLGGESGKRLVGVSGPCNAARLRAVQAGERPLERAAARSKDRPCHYCTKNCSRSGAEAALSEEAACSGSCPAASKRV